MNWSAIVVRLGGALRNIGKANGHLVLTSVLVKIPENIRIESYASLLTYP